MQNYLRAFFSDLKSANTMVQWEILFTRSRHRLGRVIAKSSNAHGHTKPFRHLKQLHRCALRVGEDGDGPSTKRRASSTPRHHRGAAVLLHKVMLLCDAAASELHALIVLTFFMPLALTSLAIVARLRSAALAMLRLHVAEHVAESARSLRASARASGGRAAPAALAAALASRHLPREILRVAGWRGVSMHDASSSPPPSSAAATGVEEEDYGQPLRREPEDAGGSAAALPRSKRQKTAAAAHS